MSIPEMSIIYLLDLFGIAVFAVSGALAAGARRMDLFGAVVLALATAVGGGTLRDLVTGSTPVFWIRDPVYVYVATGAALLTFITPQLRRTNGSALQIADALGLAVFTLLGARAGLETTGSAAIAIMMGVISAVVGGMIRDVLANRVPLILRRELYATASLLGAATYVIPTTLGVTGPSLTLLPIAVTLGVRLAAMRWHLSLPAFPR